MAKITVVDLGSNTFRAALFDCDKKEVIASYEKTVRTAEGMAKTGVISQEAIKRIIKAAQQMPGHFFAYPVTAVTTQALRKAANAKAVLKAIQQQSGLEFEIISGRREAGLTLQAVQNRLQKLAMGDASLILADIGGGSTEIIITDRGRVWMKSFEIGILTAAQTGIEACDKEFEALKSFAADKTASVFACTAGTPTTVAALKQNMTYASYDPGRINGTQITPQDLHDSRQLLQHASQQERERLVGIGRDDLIIAGIEILRRLFAIFEKDGAVVIDDGLREGAALDKCGKK